MDASVPGIFLLNNCDVDAVDVDASKSRIGSALAIPAVRSEATLFRIQRLRYGLIKILSSCLPGETV